MESNEYKLLTQQLNAMTTLINAQFKGSHERMDKINGRIEKAEIKINHHEEQITEALIERAKNREEQRNAQNVHILQCPQAKRVDALERDNLSSKAVKSWILASVAITGTVVTIIFALFKMFTGSV